MEINVNSENYLNAKNSDAGDIITFQDEGEKTELTQKDGQVKQVYNFKVTKNSKDNLVYTPNIKALALFVNSWGKDSKHWIGKSFKIRKVTMEYKGQELEVIRPVVQQEESVK